MRDRGPNTSPLVLSFLQKTKANVLAWTWHTHIHTHTHKIEGFQLKKCSSMKRDAGTYFYQKEKEKQRGREIKNGCNDDGQQAFPHTPSYAHSVWVLFFKGQERGGREREGHYLRFKTEEEDERKEGVKSQEVFALLLLLISFHSFIRSPSFSGPILLSLVSHFSSTLFSGNEWMNGKWTSMVSPSLWHTIISGALALFLSCCCCLKRVFSSKGGDTLLPAFIIS